MNKKDLYIVIMAGGQGTRLWPLSRKKLPKQLLPFHESSTLLDLTVDRIKDLVEPEHRWIVTTQDYKTLIEQQLGNSVGTVLAEPSTQNTGPAILYTCLEIYKHNPHASVIFLPADHFIEQHDVFTKDLAQAVEYATSHKAITLLGLHPTEAATGYGYIEYETSQTSRIHKIKQFHEKPDKETAAQYITNPHMLWNIGIFCGTVQTFLEQYKQHAPELTEQVNEFMEHKRDYFDITNISVDHAIMEKSNDIYVLPVNFSWSDVGNLATFLELQKSDKNNIVSLKSHDNFTYVDQDGAHTKKIITLIGVDNLCIVDTPDALLIARKDTVEDVKLLQAELRKLKLDDYL
jgi:mannose-1-phosphate guanylyltransferase